jgi:hypothetical protein
MVPREQRWSSSAEASPASLPHGSCVTATSSSWRPSLGSGGGSCPNRARPTGSKALTRTIVGGSSRCPGDRAIVRDLPGEVARALEGITYRPYVVGAVRTGKTLPMPYDAVCAAATPSMSFNMLFKTANVLRRRPREPGGSLMVYADQLCTLNQVPPGPL